MVVRFTAPVKSVFPVLNSVSVTTLSTPSITVYIVRLNLTTEWKIVHGIYSINWAAIEREREIDSTTLQTQSPRYLLMSLSTMVTMTVMGGGVGVPGGRENEKSMEKGSLDS